MRSSAPSVCSHCSASSAGKRWPRGHHPGRFSAVLATKMSLKCGRKTRVFCQSAIFWTIFWTTCQLSCWIWRAKQKKDASIGGSWQVRRRPQDGLWALKHQNFPVLNGDETNGLVGPDPQAQQSHTICYLFWIGKSMSSFHPKSHFHTSTLPIPITSQAVIALLWAIKLASKPGSRANGPHLPTAQVAVIERTGWCGLIPRDYRSKPGHGKIVYFLSVKISDRQIDLILLQMMIPASWWPSSWPKGSKLSQLWQLWFLGWYMHCIPTIHLYKLVYLYIYIYICILYT